jgi:transposase-like protein
MRSTETNRTKRTQRDYTLAFKLAVVSQVEKGEYSYIEAQRRYGIQGSSTVLTWLRKHGTLNWTISRGSAMAKTPETPEQKIKRLEQKLKDMEDLHYIQGEMLKEVDRQCGTDFEKKYLSSVPERLKHREK